MGSELDGGVNFIGLEAKRVKKDFTTWRDKSLPPSTYGPSTRRPKRVSKTYVKSVTLKVEFSHSEGGEKCCVVGFITGLSFPPNRSLASMAGVVAYHLNMPWLKFDFTIQKLSLRIDDDRFVARRNTSEPRRNDRRLPRHEGASLRVECFARKQAR